MRPGSGAAGFLSSGPDGWDLVVRRLTSRRLEVPAPAVRMDRALDVDQAPADGLPLAPGCAQPQLQREQVRRGHCEGDECRG